jgi:hypothetical protein
MPLDDLVKCANDTRCRQGEVDLDGKTFTVEVIEDI